MKKNKSHKQFIKELFSEENLEKAWKQAEEVLREAGLDPKEVLSQATKNVEKYRKKHLDEPIPENLFGE